ncbi:hypothetical protein TCAL_08890 [Tigriopus californicus]|uniref:AAA+ ATPase domain-containing protein n=2 Tax=Tigriopus californicus TaxID=6832 RepID=A0A553NVE8_TIGCA|nr:hypothetical protein TCAL_08890 [Tigriopus californicus]|eukprot:TCALIF_08890-PA protein Name:"Similar to Atad5 ATPase family AAA domain-containing protein 5 (Mus musculus)" AED:0.03 eAED:0.03 QI:0/-1/0/1/-1/1/1/0/1758
METESDIEDDTPATPILTEPAKPNRTLLHYFQTRNPPPLAAHSSNRDGKTPRALKCDEGQAQSPEKRKKKRGRPKKIIATVEQSEGTQPEEKEEDVVDVIEVLPKARNPISGFFKKVTRDEYCQDLERAASKIVIQAEIHSPIPNCSPKIEVKAKGRRGQSSRLSLDADQVNRIEVLEEQVEGVEKEEPTSRKISSALFKKRRTMRQESESAQLPLEDVSVDMDFFAGGQLSPVSADLNGHTIEMPERNGPSPKMDGIQISPVESTSKPDGGEASSIIQHLDDDDLGSKECFDSKILGLKGKKVNISPASPQLFKKRPKRRRRGTGGAATGATRSGGNSHKHPVNYDSDSLDVDILSKLNPKEFHVGQTSSMEIDFDNSSSNAFSVLMKQPLSTEAVGPNTIEDVETLDNGQTLGDRIDDGTSSRGSGGMSTCQLEDRPPNSKHKSPSSDKENKTNRLNSAVMSTLAPPPSRTATTKPPSPSSTPSSSVFENAFTRLMTTKVSISSISISSIAGTNSSPSTSSSWCKKAMKTIGLEREKKGEDQIKVGNDIGTSEVVRKKRGLKRKKKPTIKKSDVLDIEVEDVGREIVEINEEPHFPPGEDAFSAHKTERRDTLKDLEDESHLSEPSQRRSSRISRNRDTIEKRRQEQEEMERLIDDEISSPRKSRSRKIDHKRTITAEGNDFSNDGCLSNGEGDDEVRIEKVVLSPVKKQKKTGPNLAPIFIKGQKANAIRVIEDPEKAAARRAFLMSSAPDVIRTQQQQKNVDELLNSDLGSSLPFPIVSHVRQCDGEDTFWNLEMPKASPDLLMGATSLKDPSELSLRTSNNTGDDGLLDMGQFTSLVSKIGTRRNQENEKQTNDHPEAGGQRRMNSWQIYHFVKSLKMANDAFPMRKIFRRYVERKIEADTLEAEVRRKNMSLNDIVEERSKGRGRLRKARNSDRHRGGEDKGLKEVKFDASLPSSMQWTMKYTPQMTDDMIGNLGVVRKLQTWLEGWRTNRPRHSVGKRSEKRKKLDSSFVVDDSSEGDGDSISSDDLTGSGSDVETGTNLCNTALLTGPTGVGKTSCVYALARQLGFKVLEVNASSIRGGRQVVAQLQEATQSHHLTKQQQQQKQKEQAKTLQSGSRRGKSTKNQPQQDSCQGASDSSTHLKRTALILFEDIDVVFDDSDDGFYGAVNNLIATTKRPILLTTSNPHFVPKKLFKSASVLDSLQTFEFKPVAPQLVANYLQLMALAEGVAIDPESIASLVALNGGLISKSILDLQYWATSKDGGPLISCTGDIPPLICGDKLKEEGLSTSEDSLAKLMSINKHLVSNAKTKTSSGQKISHSSSSPSPLVPVNDLFATVRPFSGCDLALMGLRDEQEVSYAQTENRVQEFRNNVEHLWLWGYGDIYEQNCHLFLGLPSEPAPPPSSSGQKRPYPLTSDNSALEQDASCSVAGSKKKRYRRIQDFADLDNSIFACDSDEDEPVNEARFLTATNKSSSKDANIADKEPHEDRPRHDGDEGESSCVGGENRRPNGTNETEEREQDCSLSKAEKVKAPKTKLEKMAFQNAHQAMMALSNCAEANSHFSTLEDRPPWWVLDNSLADQMVRSSEKLLARDDAPYSQASVSASIEASVQQMTLTLARKRVQDVVKHIQGDEINVTSASHPLMRRSLESEPSLSLINDHHYPISSSRTTPLLDRFHSKETLNTFLSELTICPRTHLTDTLPIIRGMARLEEVRRSGGGAKKSRSGRFLHYFDAQELYLKPITLNYLCNSFL